MEKTRLVVGPYEQFLRVVNHAYPSSSGSFGLGRLKPNDGGWSVYRMSSGLFREDFVNRYLGCVSGSFYCTV